MAITINISRGKLYTFHYTRSFIRYTYTYIHIRICQCVCLRMHYSRELKLFYGLYELLNSHQAHNRYKQTHYKVHVTTR